MTSAAVRELGAALLDAWRAQAPWTPHPYQQPPDGGGWFGWYLAGGRGSGKSRAMAEWLVSLVDAHQGGEWRGALLSRTLADVRDDMVQGESGLQAVSARRGLQCVYVANRRRVEWPDRDAHALILTGDEPEGPRGKNFHAAWVDEPGSYPRRTDDRGGTVWSNLLLALRLGEAPQVGISGTPRRNWLVPTILALCEANPDRWRRSHGRMRDNVANLAPDFVDEITAMYAGTMLEAQEIDGVMVQDVEGSLWSHGTISQGRVAADQVPDLRRVVVGVDPPGADVAPSTAGIVVAGVASVPSPVAAVGKSLPHGYVLADRSVSGPPDVWGQAVIDAYHDFDADTVVCEGNYGWGLVRNLLATIDGSVPVDRVHATRGKQVRAEPVAAVYRQGRWHHAGSMPELEAQMTTWTPGDPSPDRMDALVWAVTSLLGRTRGVGRSHSVADMRMPVRAGAGR